MSYIEDSLVPGETILHQAKLSFAALIWPGVAICILTWISSQIHWLATLFVIFVGLMTVIQLLLEFSTTEFALTNRRIIAKKSLLRRHSLDIILSQVERVTVSQNIPGRIFGFGTVSVMGCGGTKEFFRAIDRPLELRKMVNTQIVNN